MPQAIVHELAHFSIIDPVWIEVHGAACMLRFAYSERRFLRELCSLIQSRVHDVLPASELIEQYLPKGGISSPSILSNLINALEFKGYHNKILNAVSMSCEHSWILNVPLVQSDLTIPRGFFGFQSAILSVFKCTRSIRDGFNFPIKLQRILEAKARVTLSVKGEVIHPILFTPNWYRELHLLLARCNSFTRLCWLKAVSGAWCTSARFAGAPSKKHCHVLPCVFGCNDSVDEICHYLVCPVLWQLARESLSLSESSVFVSERLCFCNPSIEKLNLLAFVHSLYHAVCNDAGCFGAEADLLSPAIVQDRAHQLCRNVRHLIRVG